MESKIEEIKKRSNKIDVEKLIKTGKNVFDTKKMAEFEDKIGPAFVLDETYTCYTDSDKLVLECLTKHCEGINPDIVTEDVLSTYRDIIYIKGQEVKELPTGTIDKSPEEVVTYEEVQKVIESANKRSDMQKQHIRNFFRRIFRRENANLLDGKSTNLTEAEIVNMLESIQEKPEKFTDKYNKEKTETDRIVDKMEQIGDKQKETEIDNEQEK